ncbi:MAG: tripartite tricarboxylate transporter substrate-binding protein, partial [Betaproteobacteria bacterium]
MKSTLVPFPLFVRAMVITVALALGTFALPSPAVAQGAYPEKPIRLIVSFPPGGSTDIVGRLVAQKVSMMWGGKPIMIENKAGASGTIGTGESIAAAPDGYTL